MPGLFDRIKDTTQYSGLLSVGTSFVVDNTPSPVYQSFRSRYAINDANIPVAVVGQATNNWMVCWCTYTALDTLRVDQIIFTSNTVTPDAAVTFSGTSDVFVASSSRAVAALREVNTFTANNYFTTGNVGIGTASPASQLHVVSATNFQPQIIADHVAGAGTGAAYFLLDRARGTPSARTAVVSGDTLGTLMARGHDGSAVQNSAWLSFDVDGTVSAGNVPAGITFLTTPVGGSAAARMHVDADGNVGIGTTGPSGNLTVFSNTGNDNSHLRVEAAVRPSFSLIHSGVRAWSFWVDTGDSSKLKIGVADTGISTGLPYITATSAGNIGIGTTAPSSKLSVSDGTVRIDLSPFSGSTGYVGTQSNHPLGIITNNAEVIRATTDGRVGIGTTNPSGYDAKLAVFNGNIALTTTTNRLYLYYASATNHAFLSATAGGEIAFSNGTAAPGEKMRIDTTGNVGIGLTSLATNTRLHIRDDNATTNEARAIIQSNDQRITLAARWQSGVEQYSYISSTTASGAATDFRIRSGATDHIILTSVGRVGVGEMSPFCRFHVRSDVTGAAPATSGTTDAATIDRIHNNVVALDTGVMANGNIWLQGRNTGNFATSYPILINPNPGTGITGALGFGTTAPRSIVHFNTASAGQFYFFQNSSGVGGTALTSTDTYPITVGNGFIGYGGLFLLPGRWGNATTVDSHNVLYLSGAQRNNAATSVDIAFANWGYFTGTTAAAGHLGNATAQADAVKFNIRHTDNGGEFNQRLTFLARSATGTTVNALQIFSSGETVLPVVGPTDVNSVGFRGSPNNDQSGSTYTLALTDAGRTIRKTVTAAQTVTIPADATVNFPLGTCIMLCNVVDGSSTSAAIANMTIACAASGPTLVWLSGTTKNNRVSGTNTTIAGGGSATLRKVAANLWTITGSGVA